MFLHLDLGCLPLVRQLDGRLQADVTIVQHHVDLGLVRGAGHGEENAERAVLCRSLSKPAVDGDELARGVERI